MLTDNLPVSAGFPYKFYKVISGELAVIGIQIAAIFLKIKPVQEQWNAFRH